MNFALFLERLKGSKMIDYENFLKGKSIVDSPDGFMIELEDLNPMLFDWQKVLTQWALMRGRAALFEDCGLGKTPQQLVWAYHVSKRMDAPVVILAPLAVAQQTKREGDKFGVKVHISTSQRDIKNGINVTNYEKLHKYDPSKFAGVVCDESSILKHFTAVTRTEIIEAFCDTPFRLACTATPAPNDYSELGNHAEYLGIMSRSEMLSTFFVNDTSDTGTWRLRGHVRENVFWKWLSSWAVMMTKPSDLEFDDDGFILPEIRYHEHILKAEGKPITGFFHMPVTDLNDRRRVRRESQDNRCHVVADLINATNEGWVVWCNLNSEGEQLTELVDEAVEVAGRHSEEVKVDRLAGFANGKYRRLVTKPKMAGLGMNFQICHNAAFVGLNDSWEQLYQAIRRIWRFGQDQEVDIHIFMDEREGPILRNIKEKDDRARRMIENMVRHTKELTKIELTKTHRETDDYFPEIDMEVPMWLTQ